MPHTDTDKADGNAHPMMSAAFVTPTFTPDLGRCELLVESLDRFAPETRHYLLVDAREIRKFQHLGSARTIVVPSEEVIDSRFTRLPGARGFWVSWHAPPVRGWIMQQLLKLASPKVVAEDVIICVDSDTAFIRRFTRDHVFREAKIGLLDVDYAGGMVPRWTSIAAELLGVDLATCPSRGHVGELIAWSRQHLLGLHERIESASDLPWQVAIARKTTFSEYILYGTYIRCLLGYDASNHVPATKALVRQPWDHDLSDAAALRKYIADPEPDNIAVMIHSKSKISAAQLRPIFEEAWKHITETAI